MSYIADRRQEEKDRRRGEIVDAAETLYRDLGWDAVTMDSVAKKARLSRAFLATLSIVTASHPRSRYRFSAALTISLRRRSFSSWRRSAM